MDLARSRRIAFLGGLLLLVLGAGPDARANEPLTLEELNARFGMDFDTTEIRTQKIDDGFYVLFGLGGNIAVSIGRSGTLIVDDQFPQLAQKIEKAIQAVGGKRVDYVVNTHGHFDHADGNKFFGPEGSRIVSHRNARDLMERGGIVNLVIAEYRQAPYPSDALPTFTFDDRMQIHFNDETIELVHPGPAHTSGDAAVLFRGRNAVHMGDVFNNTGYPFIDVDNGGGIDGMIAFCRAVLGEIGPDTTVIPGHGEVTDVARLERYVGMLEGVRSRVAGMIAEGKRLDEVIAADPTADFAADFGDVGQSLGFVDRVYTSLQRQAE